MVSSRLQEGLFQIAHTQGQCRGENVSESGATQTFQGGSTHGCAETVTEEVKTATNPIQGIAPRAKMLCGGRDPFPSPGLRVRAVSRRPREPVDGIVCVGRPPGKVARDATEGLRGSREGGIAPVYKQDDSVPAHRPFERVALVCFAGSGAWGGAS
jgi:hypothetical protein